MNKTTCWQCKVYMPETYLFCANCGGSLLNRREKAVSPNFLLLHKSKYKNNDPLKKLPKNSLGRTCPNPYATGKDSKSQRDTKYLKGLPKVAKQNIYPQVSENIRRIKLCADLLELRNASNIEQILEREEQLRDNIMLERVQGSIKDAARNKDYSKRSKDNYLSNIPSIGLLFNEMKRQSVNKEILTGNKAVRSTPETTANSADSSHSSKIDDNAECFDEFAMDKLSKLDRSVVSNNYGSCIWRSQYDYDVPAQTDILGQNNPLFWGKVDLLAFDNISTESSDNIPRRNSQLEWEKYFFDRYETHKLAVIDLDKTSSPTDIKRFSEVGDHWLERLSCSRLDNLVLPCEQVQKKRDVYLREIENKLGIRETDPSILVLPPIFKSNHHEASSDWDLAENHASLQFDDLATSYEKVNKQRDMYLDDIEKARVL